MGSALYVLNLKRIAKPGAVHPGGLINTGRDAADIYLVVFPGQFAGHAKWFTIIQGHPESSAIRTRYSFDRYNCSITHHTNKLHELFLVKQTLSLENFMEKTLARGLLFPNWNNKGILLSGKTEKNITC